MNIFEQKQQKEICNTAHNVLNAIVKAGQNVQSP